MKYLLYRLILKVYTLCENLINTANLEVCKIRGMVVGKNFNMPGRVDFGTEPYLIQIGDHVNIANGVRFVNHGGTTRVLRRIEGYEDARIFGRIKIGNNCTIGLQCIITQDVQIGNNCILGAGSVLTQSMPDNTVFNGNPAEFLCNVEDYGDIVLLNNTIYPRELESNRLELDQYLKKHLPYKFRKARRIRK